MSGYGNSFGLWRQVSGQEWGAYTSHAFVQGLGDGTLPQEAFLKYLVQDYVFLTHYARAWALAVTKAETLPEMQLCASTLDVLVNQEMQLHVGICAQHGLSEQDLFNAPEEIANLAYTRYVLDAGHSGDFLDLMAALAPCVMGYGEIGLALAKSAAPDTPYRAWIDTYASDDFQSACEDVGRLIDQAVALRIGDAPHASPRWARLTQRFQMATRLEIGFWQMGLE